MKPTIEKETTETAEAPRPERPARPDPKYPPLSIETAKIIIEDFLMHTEYDEWAIDGLLRIFCGLLALDDREKHDYIDWLVRFLYAETWDFVDRMQEYAVTLPGKSYRDDGIRIDQIGALRENAGASETLIALRDCQKRLAELEAKQQAPAQTEARAITGQ
ncbi:MAG TPA: hypothetical protein VFD58_01190 [Blastocatellia bacterium]|nr:hypothetical protein [Blastocatellia bacterium]